MGAPEPLVTTLSGYNDIFREKLLKLTPELPKPIADLTPRKGAHHEGNIDSQGTRSDERRPGSFRHVDGSPLGFAHVDGNGGNSRPVAPARRQRSRSCSPATGNRRPRFHSRRRRHRRVQRSDGRGTSLAAEGRWLQGNWFARRAHREVPRSRRRCPNCCERPPVGWDVG